MGGIYSLFNPIALYRFEVNQGKCTGCKACQRGFPMDLPVYQTPNTMECIRCGKCLKVCKNHSLHSTFSKDEGWWQITKKRVSVRLLAVVMSAVILIGSAAEVTEAGG